MDRFRIIKPIIYAYILFIGFTSAFALTPIISIPFILANLLFVTNVIYSLSKSKIYPKYNIVDIFIIGFLCILIFSFFINYLILPSSKSINHLFAYLFTLLMYYLNIKYLFKLTSIKIDKVFKMIYYSVLLVSILGIVEFVLKNVFIITDFETYIPRPVANDYDPTVLAEYIRSRSVVEESGHLALFIEILSPFAWYYLYKVPNQISTVVKHFSFLSILICFLLAFSSIGFVILFFVLISLFIRSSFNILKSGIIKKQSLILLLLAIIGVYFTLKYSNALEILEDVVVSKLGSKSGTDRSSRILEGLETAYNGNFISYLFGYGPGAYEKLNIESIVGLFQNLILELGILGTFFFGLVYLSSLWELRHITDNTLKIVFHISIGCSFFHYFVISNYWYPWLWLVFALIPISKINHHSENIAPNK